jgi:ornithine cyclodeaminase/alanine dehydrogenase
MHTSTDFLHLSDSALEQLGIRPSEVADAIEVALLAKADGRLHTTPKSAILPGQGRYMMSTLAVGDDGFVVVKQVSVCPDNPQRGLPAINGAIMALDAQTGLLRAVVGANWITAVRTAALSAVAARRLADPASRCLAFVGTGVQAHSHLAAFAQMFPLERVQVYGRGQANIDKLCNTARAAGLEAQACSDPQAALSGADLVVSSVTLDFSIPPFLDARWLKPNAFATITDACIPWYPEGMATFGSIIVDDRQQEAESAQPMVDPARISGDLTELVAGSAPAPIAGKPAAFAFRGLALGDYAATVLAVQRAEAAGLGTPIQS